MTNAAQGRYTASFFFDALIHALGKLSGYQPYVGIPHLEVSYEALRAVGIDPEDPPVPLHGRHGLLRKVHFAWRNQAAPECGRKDPLTARGACTEVDKNGRPKVSKGLWSLTALGVRKALLLRPVFENDLQNEDGPNLTAQWIAHHWDALWPRVMRHLNRTMPRSAEFGKVEDHIANYFAGLISRDGLANYIESGRLIRPSEVCAWARRSAYSDIRNEGREPVCRLFHGALTKKEIGDFDPSNWTEEVIPNSINHSDRLDVSSYYLDTSASNELGDVPCTTDFIVDTQDFESEVVGEEAIQLIVQRMSAVIDETISPEKDPEWHRQVAYDRFVLEMSVKEIAAARGLNYDTHRNKITLALNRVRRAMQGARDAGALDDVMTRR